jgi:hypothetical protein
LVSSSVIPKYPEDRINFKLLFHIFFGDKGERQDDLLVVDEKML